MKAIMQLHKPNFLPEITSEKLVSTVCTFLQEFFLGIIDKNYICEEDEKKIQAFTTEVKSMPLIKLLDLYISNLAEEGFLKEDNALILQAQLIECVDHLPKTGTISN